MSKQYNRKRTNRPFIYDFECKKCGEKFPNKPAFKQHWHEAAEHDQRIRV